MYSNLVSKLQYVFKSFKVYWQALPFQVIGLGTMQVQSNHLIPDKYV